MDPGARSTAFILLLAACTLAAAQQPESRRKSPSMPSWLVSYPGVTPDVQERASTVETAYTTPAKPADVVEHYRNLFEAAGLRFQPNADGIGTSIRGAAPECDLLISIRQQSAGTFVDVRCASKSVPAAGSSAKPVEIITPTGPSAGSGERHVTAAEMQARHGQMVKELGIHPVYRDAPAPALVWPSWLVHMNGAKLRIQQGVDQSRKGYLESRCISTQPMSAIYKFYEELLDSHEYRVHSSKLSTGQTISGVKQNAWGYAEGTNYPDGAPGPRTVIRVDFSRANLNDPITVRMRITAYEFVAPKSRF